MTTFEWINRKGGISADFKTKDSVVKGSWFKHRCDFPKVSGNLMCLSNCSLIIPVSTYFTFLRTQKDLNCVHNYSTNQNEIHKGKV